MRGEFEPETWAAFEAVWFEKCEPLSVADRLGVAVHAVYVGKSRVLKRLRACAACRAALDALSDGPDSAAWMADAPPPAAHPSLDPPGRAGDLGRLGGYAVEAEIGRGGMGVVFRGRDEALGRLVALKVLRAGRGGPAAAARFDREARAVASLRHDHVVPVFAVGRAADGRPSLVMPLVTGPSLRERLRAGLGLTPPPRSSPRSPRDWRRRTPPAWCTGT